MQTGDVWSYSQELRSTSVPDPKFVAKVPGAAPGSRGATSEHMAYM